LLKNHVLFFAFNRCLGERKAKSSEEKKFDEAEIFPGKEINEEM
jgi:hypothetical protein